MLYEKIRMFGDGKTAGEYFEIQDADKFIEEQEKKGLKCIYHGKSFNFPKSQKSYSNIIYICDKTQDSIVFANV